MSKTAAGLGSVYQTKNGRWVATLPADPRTGKRRAFTAKTQAEAVQKREAAAQRLKQFGDLATADPTVETYLRQWLAHTLRVRATTRDSYTLNVEKRIIPAIGKVRLSLLQPMDVRRMMDAVAKRSSPATANQARRVLRKALNDARGDRILIGDNAAALAKRLPQERYEASILDAGQLAHLLASVAEPLRSLILVAVSLGVRQGEVLGLRWADLVLDGKAQQVSIKVQLQEVDAVPAVVDPKTNKAARVLTLVDLKTKSSRRTFPLSPNLAAALRAHKARQATRAMELGALWRNRLGLVFVGDDGAPLRRVDVTRRFQAAVKTAGLPKVRFHDLRHGAATLSLVRNGGDLKATAMMLGHSTITMVADIYSHLGQDVMARNVALLDDLAALPSPVERAG